MTIAYAVEPRKGEMFKLEWQKVDMRRQEFTIRKTKNGETRVVPMTPDVLAAFLELGKDRRLDTNQVFLYKGSCGRTPGRCLRGLVAGRELRVSGRMISGIAWQPTSCGKG